MPKTECTMTPKPAARPRAGARRRAPGAGSAACTTPKGAPIADRGEPGRRVARHRHRPRLAGGADVLERAQHRLGERRGGDAVQGVEVEMVGAEAAQARLERAGDELGRQRQRLRRLDARAAQQRRAAPAPPAPPPAPPASAPP